MTEEWRPWRDGAYEVSDLGRVRRAKAGRKTHAGRLMTPIKMGIGYFMVSPTVDGKNAPTHIHRMVAECFIGPSEGREVNHIDGDKGNNVVGNLEYVTHRGNMEHAARTGLMVRGINHPQAKFTDADVRLIRAEYDAGATSMQILADQYDVAIMTIHSIIRRKTWRHVE